MSGQTRKLHYKEIRDFAAEHVGRKGDIWYDPTTTALRFYNGDPGGEPLSAGGFSLTSYLDYGSLDTSQNVAIDLTKKYHWLVALNSNQQHYTLADGVDGQELVFFTSNGYTGDDKCDVWVNSVYCFNGTTNYSYADRIVRIFDQETTNQIRTKTTAMWLNGGWHFDHHVLEIGSFL